MSIALTRRVKQLEALTKALCERVTWLEDRAAKLEDATAPKRRGRPPKEQVEASVLPEDGFAVLSDAS